MLDGFPYSLKHLRLRTLRPDDLDAFYVYRSDPAVARYQGWDPMTTCQAMDFLRSQGSQTNHVPGTWRQFAIADLKSDLLIGDIGLWLSPDCLRAEFGLSITPAAQGNGYGTECVRGLMAIVFSTTTAVEMVARTDIRNFACLAVLARSGMRHVDTRQAEYKGELCTEHVFSVHGDETNKQFNRCFAANSP
jgi:RimJ/RimL family protein N-acetyltransferase